MLHFERINYMQIHTIFKLHYRPMLPSVIQKECCNFLIVFQLWLSLLLPTDRITQTLTLCNVPERLHSLFDPRPFLCSSVLIGPFIALIERNCDTRNSLSIDLSPPFITFMPDPIMHVAFSWLFRPQGIYAAFEYTPLTYNLNGVFRI